MRIDLHSHSTHSDGNDSVLQILTKAEKLKIKGLCISDHDNLNGSIEAFEIADNIYSGKLISGIELSTKVNGKTIHLLAYFPTHHIPENSELIRNLNKIKSDRVNRMKKMIYLANQSGYEITFDEILNEVKGSDDVDQPIDIISRPHFAKVFVKKGYAKDLNDAFDNFIGEGKPLHAKRFSLNYLEWIDIVHKMKGIISWAHPLHNHNDSLGSVKNTAEKLVGKIDAIELYYRYDGKYNVSKELQEIGFEYLDGIIKKNNMLATAGGDYHGNVGILGGVDLPEDDWNKFIDFLYKINSN